MADNSELAPAPTECVMIKQEVDIDLDYDTCERNVIDTVEEDENELVQPDEAQLPTMYHGTYLPHLNTDPLANKRKADDRFQTCIPTVNSIYSLSTGVHQPPPNKKPARVSQTKENTKKTNNQKKEDDGENALRIKYLTNASKTEEQMRNLQMELSKARLEREKMQLENIREMHRLQLENLKLEKEILAMKLKNVSEQGVGVV